ncbi:MAG: tyrosine-type recombinase/integrase [Spirochaetia bacterium]|jgi:integrase
MGRRKKAFSLYVRRVIRPGKKTPVKVYYYRTYDERGRRTVGRSTGKETVPAAEEYCHKLQAAGQLVTGPQDAKAPESTIPTLAAWAATEHWWNWGECKYLRRQLNRSDESRPAVSRRYADDALRDFKHWILPYHGDKRLDEITPKDCEELLTAWQDKGLSRKSINNKASVYRIMLKEAERLGVISRTPWARVEGFKPTPHAKGILSMEEARILLNPATIGTIWDDNQLYHSASLLASVTGMRLGEILALRREDLFPDHVHVAGSWGKLGLQPTKTKRVDDIPIPRFVFDTILTWCAWEGYLFSFKLGERPANGNRCNDALTAAMENIGITAEERTRRVLSFHSWRAFANTYMRAAGISGEKVRQLTRHATAEMTEHYSAFRLEDFKDIAAAQEQLIAGIQMPTRVAR